MLFINAMLDKVLAKYIKKKKRFSATANARNDFNHSIPLGFD